MKQKSEKQFSKRKIIAFCLIIFVAIFGVLEISSYFLISRYAETGTFKDREIQNPFHPFAGWSHPPNAHIKTIRNNSAGDTYIDTDGDGNSLTPLSFPNPELRMIVTGGSTMFGVGSSSNKTTVASLLEQKVYDRLGVKVEVTNLGTRGYQSFQEMLRLHEFLLNKEADIVLAVSGRNDASFARRQRNIRNALLQQHVYLNAVPLVRAAELQKPILLNVDGFFRQYSYFFDLLARAIHRIAPPIPPEPNTPDAQQVELAKSGELFSNIPERAGITLSHYKLMDAISRNNHSRFYFILQPSAYSWAHYPGGIAPLLKDPEKSLIEKKYENLFYEALLERAGNFPVFDFRQVMDIIKAPIPYQDSTHYTDAGADVLSDSIFELIKPEILRRVPRLKGERP